MGDYDNDGHPDLFVTRLRTYALYHNRGDGTFEDVTARAGLAGHATCPPRRHSPISTTTATSTSTSATTCSGTRSTPSLQECQRRPDLLRSAQGRARSRPCLPQRRRSFRGCHDDRPASPRAKGVGSASSPPTSMATISSTSTSPTTARPTTYSATEGLPVRGSRA